MAEFANNTTMAADNSASSIDASSKKGAKKGKVANTSKLVNAIEDEQVDELYEMDDWGSSWKICKESGLKWGGRGFGGRAAGRMTVQARDVVIEGCTMAYLGTNLLDRTTVRLLHKRRYGLIGRNGVGKSTLMRRIASGTLPGFPHHLRVAQVQQELPVVDSDTPVTPLDYILANDPVRKVILRKIAQIENDESGSSEDSEEENGGVTAESLEAEADFLQSLYDLLEDENVIKARAIRILKDLGFSAKRREADMRNMSGGWRMRVAIACALTQEPDVLLLDEPTNHLDLEGVEWLRSYLVGPAAEDLTVLITSHDSNFLDDVCTDIIRFHRQQLHYYPGNYSTYEMARSDKETGLARTQEKVDKQRKELEESIRKMQIAASRDTSGKGSGQVASRKKKLARHGAEKNVNGHRFRAQQDSSNGMSAVRAGSQNEVALGAKTGQSRCLIDAAEREWKMSLPDPVPLSLLEGCSCLQLRNATVGFATPTASTGAEGQDKGAAAVTAPAAPQSGSKAPTPAAGPSSSLGSKKVRAVAAPVAAAPKVESTMVVENVTLDAHQKSKIAILGKNGCGKSTLMKLIHSYGQAFDSTELGAAEDTSAAPVLMSGEVSRHNSLRTAYFQQHQQECLPYDLSPLEYLASVAPLASQSEQLLRAHLGSFGLSGDLALQQIGKLSGGQKSRVVLAALTIHRPHLLLLDEPTNNLDLDSIRAMKEAIAAYNGACIIASHDMNFVNGTCTEVYHIAKNRLVRLEGGTAEFKEVVAKAVAAQRRANT